MSPAQPPNQIFNFLQSAHLCVLVDSVDYLDDPSAPRLERLVKELLSADVCLIQLRDKRLSDRQAVDVATRMAGWTENFRTAFIMNDRADLALAAGADGVHLGQDDLPIEAARQILGGDKIIGISTHSLAQAQEAKTKGANYIGVGPVFASKTKSFDTFVGLELVAEVAKEIDLPAFAIGGIDLTNVDQVAAHGLRRIAVSSVITQSANPAQTARELFASVAPQFLQSDQDTI